MAGKAASREVLGVGGVAVMVVLSPVPALGAIAGVWLGIEEEVR